MSSIEKSDYITDVTDKIDALIDQAHRSRSKKEKQSLLKEAQDLADEYQNHVEQNGNTAKQFIQF